MFILVIFTNALLNLFQTKESNLSLREPMKVTISSHVSRQPPFLEILHLRTYFKEDKDSVILRRIKTAEEFHTYCDVLQMLLFADDVVQHTAEGLQMFQNLSDELIINAKAARLRMERLSGRRTRSTFVSA